MRVWIKHFVHELTQGQQYQRCLFCGEVISEYPAYPEGYVLVSGKDTKLPSLVLPEDVIKPCTKPKITIK